MSVLIFLSAFSLYLTTLAPSFTVGDAGELCATSVILGLAHSPGYPLFSLMGKIFTILIPWGSFAFRINILSAAAGAATVAMLYRFLLLLPLPSMPNRFFAAGAALLAGVTPAFWNSSIQTEVFSLNTLFAVLILISLIKKRYVAAAFLYGLGLGNHHTLIFIFPLAVIFMFRDRVFDGRRLLQLCVFFVIGFSVYLYLPIRSFANPALDWGNPETPYRFWRVLSRADYGTMALTTGEKMAHSLPVIYSQIVRFLTIFNQQFTLIGLLVGCLGWYLAIKNRYAYARELLAGWLLAGPGFIIFANLPFNAESEGILERFYVLSNLFWAAPLFWTLSYLRKSVLSALAVAAGVIIIATLHFSGSDWRAHYLAYDYGRNVLRTLAPDSVLLMDGGDDTFYSTAYFCFAERRRRDVELHDRGGLVFKNIYGADFRQLGREEKERRRQEIERKFLGQRPVYFSTFNRSVMPDVELAPDGVLYRPREASGADSMACYSMRGIFGPGYRDYRSRALAPLYPYFLALRTPLELTHWKYIYRRWQYVPWVGSNVKIELQNVAFGAFSKGELAAAAKTYAQLLLFYPEDAYSLVNLGVIEEKQNNPAGAKACYEKAIAANPSYGDAYYNLAVLYWQQKNWPEAIKHLKNLLSINPKDQRALHYLPIAEKFNTGEF